MRQSLRRKPAPRGPRSPPCCRPVPSISRPCSPAIWEARCREVHTTAWIVRRHDAQALKRHDARRRRKRDSDRDARLVAAALLRWRELGWESLVWLAAFVAGIAIRTPYAAANRRKHVIQAHRDGAEFMLLFAMFVTMMVLPVLHLATGVFAFADYRLPIWAPIAGAAMQLPYLWLFWRSHADLGVNWSPGLEVGEQHRLITNGVYTRIRHPMYAAIWISAVAQPLLVQNWIAGALVVPAFAAMYFIRVPREEAMMRTQFGDEYALYSARTGRVWPR